MATERKRILQLMFGKKERYRTARATIREWRDEKTLVEVRKRFRATEPYRRVFGPPKQQAAKSGPAWGEVRQGRALAVERTVVAADAPEYYL